MARIDQSEDWRERHAPTISTFESLAIEAYGHLPQEFRDLSKDLIIEITDFPTDEVFEDMALETPFDLLGLFGSGASAKIEGLAAGQYRWPPRRAPDRACATASRRPAARTSRQ